MDSWAIMIAFCDSYVFNVDKFGLCTAFGGLFAQFYVCKALAELVALPMAAPSPSAGEGARRHNRARYYADVMVSDLRAPVEPFS